MDHIARMEGGVTGPWWIRADDGRSYVAKDEIPGLTTVRSSEWIWLSIANEVRLPASKPDVLDDRKSGRMLVGTLREQSAIGKDQLSCQTLFYSGQIIDGSKQLSRIHAFDLFSGNPDRHPGNYLVLNDDIGPVVTAIDFSHAGILPGEGTSDALTTHCNTRAFFPSVISHYGHDLAAALETIDRLEQLLPSTIDTILTRMPDEWLSQADRLRVIKWWEGEEPKARAILVKQELQHAQYV